MVGGAVLLVANHVSWLDILALGGASGTAFVAKDDLENTPLVGWLCRMNRTVFIPRHNRRGVRKQVERVRTALSEPGRVTIFPEGTTGDGETLLPFKPAMFAALLPPPAGLTVQPVFIDYGELSPWIGWTGEEGGVANFLKVLGRRGSFPLELHFLEPFNPQDFADRKEIAAVARSAIAEKVAATGKGQAH
jgi:1-acyl-sn-glycerol-3-phosphate acyltransferase